MKTHYFPVVGFVLGGFGAWAGETCKKRCKSRLRVVTLHSQETRGNRLEFRSRVDHGAVTTHATRSVPFIGAHDESGTLEHPR